MNGIITHKIKKVLIERVKALSENSGIENQITHLYSPDDNESFDPIFYYLEDHMIKQINGWAQLLRDIHRTKRALW